MGTTKVLSVRLPVELAQDVADRAASAQLNPNQYLALVIGRALHQETPRAVSREAQVAARRIRHQIHQARIELDALEQQCTRLTEDGQVEGCA